MPGLFIFIFSIFAASSDHNIMQDAAFLDNNVYDKRIKTVQLYKEGWNLSYPVISLNSDEKLILHFDLLGDNIETYDYTFIHCDKDWNRSDIFTNEYLEGFPENHIEDVKSSFNTTVSYIHYKLAFPNDRVKMILSGNYILSIYPYDNPDKPVITRRFILSENVAKIKIDTHRPQMTSDNNSRQQVDFTINLNAINVTDLYRDIFSSVLQNGRWNNSKKNLKPDVSGGNELKYNSLSEKNIFNGGNEFRYFDIRSIKYQSEYVNRIDFMPPYYNVYLKPSENREFKPYFYWQDFNGKYYVATREGENPETDADYVNVFFTLPSKYMLSGGKMYVSGDFNGWSFNENNLMSYNPQAGQYECTMLLKQGWYNYEYVFLRDGEKDAVASKFEGSHYETENDYLVLVYYRNPTERYDRVIGTAAANTSNRMSY
jgi:hypothetical protein